MNQTDFKGLLAEERFSPFVITTNERFSVAVGPEQRGHVLAGARMIVMLDADALLGRFALVVEDDAGVMRILAHRNISGLAGSHFSNPRP